jgi:hypothetical protein
MSASRAEADSDSMLVAFGNALKPSKCREVRFLEKRLYFNRLRNPY